jgi:hypothetical protein
MKDSTLETIAANEKKLQEAEKELTTPVQVNMWYIWMMLVIVCASGAAMQMQNIQHRVIVDNTSLLQVITETDVLVLIGCLSFMIIGTKLHVAAVYDHIDKITTKDREIIENTFKEAYDEKIKKMEKYPGNKNAETEKRAS